MFLRFEITVDPVLCERIFHRLAQKRRISKGRYLLDLRQIALALFIKFAFQQWHIERHKRLLKRAKPVAKDRDQQQHEHGQACANRRKPVHTEPRFSRIALFGTRIEGQKRGFHRITHSYCSRYLRTM